MGRELLRVIDFGAVSPLRSQTLWHCVARGVSEGAGPTLCFVRPLRPYVSLGYHGRADSVNWRYCRRKSIPVFRREVGGGTVYLDCRQMFFQLCLPIGSVSPDRRRALRSLLEPVVGAFRAAGLDARLDGDAEVEILVGERKVCGHGAGQIGQAVVVVGNLIEQFDHHRAAAVLAAPSESARAVLAQLIKRYVGPPKGAALRVDAFSRAAVDAYASALGLAPVEGQLSRYERESLSAVDSRLCDRHWVRGRPKRTGAAWRVKVRSGVELVGLDVGAGVLLVVLLGGRLHPAGRCGEAPGVTGELASALAGLTPQEASEHLVDAGGAGAALARALMDGFGGSASSRVTKEVAAR